MYIKLHSIFTTHDKMEINKHIHVSKISFMCMYIHAFVLCVFFQCWECKNLNMKCEEKK
jgi:hypothetical protein